MGIFDGVTNYHNQILDDKHVFLPNDGWLSQGISNDGGMTTPHIPCSDCDNGTHVYGTTCITEI